jgi:hypothetical protein
MEPGKKATSTRPALKDAEFTRTGQVVCICEDGEDELQISSVGDLK